MSIITLIAVVDKNNGLGKENKLLCHLPADLKHFKKITYGKPIVMGRKTYESIGRPLPGRTNIVLTTKKTLYPLDILTASSLEKLLIFTKDFPEIMIIGGEEIFKQFFSLATRMHLTVIDHCFDADVFFPQLTDEWQLKEQFLYPKDQHNFYNLKFMYYERVSSYT